MRRLLFLVLMISSLEVWASERPDYYWYPQGHASTPAAFHSTPADVCEWYVRNRVNQGPNTFVESVVPVNDVTFTCRYSRHGYSNIYSIAINFSGSCPVDSPMNPETGECEEPDRCTEVYGMGTTHHWLSHTRTNPYDPWPSGPYDAPSSVCRDSCRFVYKPGTLQCGTLVEEGPQSTNRYCLGLYVGDGDECSAGDPPISNYPSPSGPGDGSGEGEPGEPSDPLDFPPLTNPDGGDPTDPANNCGPGYAWSGTTCVKVLDNSSDPGGGSSGGGSGGGNDGGGDSGGGGDDGSTGGDPGTGTGDDGSTGGGGSPGQDRDGEHLVKGVSCADERPVECKGDAYDCAVFWHVREQNCRAEQLFKESEEGNAEVSARVQGVIDGEGDAARFTDEDTEEVELQGFINKRSRFLPAYCPPPVNVVLTGTTIQWDLQPICDFAEQIGNLIVAFAALVAALYVGRSFGGN